MCWRPVPPGNTCELMKPLSPLQSTACRTPHALGASEGTDVQKAPRNFHMFWGTLLPRAGCRLGSGLRISSRAGSPRWTPRRVPASMGRPGVWPPAAHSQLPVNHDGVPESSLCHSQRVAGTCADVTPGSDGHRGQSGTLSEFCSEHSGASGEMPLSGDTSTVSPGGR